MRRFFPLALLFCLLLGHLLMAAGPPGVWLDVPFVKQAREGCGSASVAMLMQYWQRQQGKPQSETADAAHIQSVLYSSEGRGIYASQLERYLRQQGFQTFAFRGEWDDLRQHLEKGRPLLVALQPGSGALHYEIVVGLNWDERTVLVNDPAQRKLLKQEWPSFERQWSAAGKWMLLAVPSRQAR
jgi:ABC-type bacteriocin/lantibiotic exporter with double-glycine peptidase domain